MGDVGRVLIRGDGVAAACCARLLRRGGLKVRIEAAGRRPAPVVLLSDAALALMSDVLGPSALPIAGSRIHRRIVAWGGAEPVVLPHGAVAVTEAALHESLRHEAADDFETPDLTLHASDPLPPDALRRRFGDRQAHVARVTFKNEADGGDCRMESVQDGWLFLMPGPPGSAWLLAVGAAHETLLAQSRLIAPRVADLASAGAFDSSPRLASPAHGLDWLACGATALAFDPICGDGTAQAVRQAILAAAVITAIAEGGDRPALATHYDAMLTAAMRRHLALCLEFYRSGGDGVWWRKQAEQLVEGHAWCTARLARTPEPAFQLRGFRLVDRETAA